MDSVVGDDPTLPVDFEASANLSNLPDVTTGPPDITSTNFEDHFPDGTTPVLQNVSSGRMSPIRAHTMKDYEQQISDLKKENFSLKLRIYFMEERLQPNFEENDDIKTNIELKVEVESLKKDLLEKQQLLFKASNAVESLVQEKEAIAVKLKEENRNALEQLRDRFQTEAEQSKKVVRELNEAMKDLQRQLADAQTQADREPVQSITAEQEKISDLEDVLKAKDNEIAELEGKQDRANHLVDELKRMKEQLESMGKENESLKADLDKEKTRMDPHEPLQEAYLEQETRLKDLETASVQINQQLEDKDKAIKDLENEVQKANKEVQDLTGDVANKETDLESHKTNALKRDKAIQGLTEMIRNKDKEIKQLCDQIDDQETALSKAREAVHKAEKNKYEGLEQYQASMSDMETKLDETKASLHRKHLDNERLQKAVVRKNQEMDKSRQDKATADAQLDQLLDEKGTAMKDLKDDLKEAKVQAENKAAALEDHYQVLLEDAQQQLQNKEQIIKRLTKGLEEKDKSVQEYMELAWNIHRPINEDKDGKQLIIQSLRERLKQRDKAVEDAIEEKFQLAEMKDGEMRKLRVALRERDREIEKAGSDLLGAQDMINQVEDSIQLKDAKNRQLRDTLLAQAKANQDAEEAHHQAQKIKDADIKKLKQDLADKDKIIGEQRDAHGTGPGRDEVIEQLNDRIKDKEKLMKDMLAERNQMTTANEKEMQDLLETLRGKDNQIRELHNRHNKMMASKNEMLKELQKDLNDKEYDIQSAEDTLARAEEEQAALLNKMRNALAEKDKTIEKLLNSGQEKDRLFWEMQNQSPPRSPGLLTAEMMRIKDDHAKLKKSLREKDALLDYLRAHPEPDHAKSLEDELENKNKLLNKAKDTIETLQRDQNTDRQFRIDMSKLRRQNIELQSELQAKQDHIDALVHAGKVKDNIIQELRLHDSGLPVRNATINGDYNNQLQQALIDHLAELSRLSDALKTERQLYVNITQRSGPADSSKHSYQTEPSNALDIELSAVQALRKQLEEGIKRNKEIRNNLLRQQTTTDGDIANKALSSEDAEETAAENQALTNQLEVSRRRNASLQLRLDEMKQRADGVGSDVEPVVHTLKSDEDEPQVDSQQAQDSQLLNEMRRRQSLEDRLERQEVESLRSIPGQEEETPSKKVSPTVQRQLEELQTKLNESESERNTLTQHLEAVMLNQSQPEPDGGPVVPILKQQLDQAKTLLMEKDRKLQEKEQQNQALRHHLGIGPSSPITPGRSLLAHLQQELQETKLQNHHLEQQLHGLQTHCVQAKQIKEALQQQLMKLTQSRPSEEEQYAILAKELEKANVQVQRRDVKNRELRQMLGIGPDAPVEDGQIVIDKSQQENAKLRMQLEESVKDVENLRAQLDLATKELEEQVESTDNKDELARLKKQLKNADKLNELLKQHIELNSSFDGNQSFNPDLIVDMAKEIEHLQDELDQSTGDKGKKVSKDSQVGDVLKEDGSAKDRSTINAYKKELRKVEGELDEAKQKLRAMQRKLQATEGTVRHQAEKIKHYRREMHNAGIAPPGTPKRVRSESNLLQSSLLTGRIRSMSDFGVRSVECAGSSSSVSPGPPQEGRSVSDMTFSEFGSTEDVTELKEQITILRNQLQRLRRAVRHLQRQLRATEGSRSPSPTRSVSDSWFELTANQEAFEKMRMELDNLSEQLKKTNDANLTLQERNLQLHDEICDSWARRNTLDKQSQTKMDVDGTGKNKDDEQWKKLNKELQERKKLNKKLRDLLAENQQVAEETGRELERLAKAVEEKNTTISRLRKQLREVLANRSSKTSSQVPEDIDQTTRRTQNKTSPDSQSGSGQDERDAPNVGSLHGNRVSTTQSKSSTVQTDQWTNVSSAGDNTNRIEVNNLKTKLRETERLSKTLNTELDIYRKVLDGWHGIPTESKQEGYQQQDPNEVLQEHLEEIRALRKRLEESINVNDRLREQLEAKLAGGDQIDGEGTTNIYLHQTHIELTEENSSLKEQLSERKQLIRHLNEELRKTRVHIQRVNLENDRLKEQLEENVHLTESLRFELNVYEHLQEKQRTKDNSGSTGPRLTDPSSGIDLTELLREIRHLRIQLERSIDTNNALRLKLEEMMNDKSSSKSSPSTITVTTTRRMENKRHSSVHRSLFQDEQISHPKSRNTNNRVDNSTAFRVQDHTSHSARTQDYSNDMAGEMEEPEFYSIPSGAGPSTSNNYIPSPYTNGNTSLSKLGTVQLSKSGEELHAICTLETYKSIQRSLHEGRALGKLTAAKLLESAKSSSTAKYFQELSKNVRHINACLEQCNHLLLLFWKSKLPQKDDEQVDKLKKRLCAQEKLMREALDRLSITNRMKEGMEQAIIDQLAITHNVLRQARGNLEAQPRRASSTSSEDR